MEIKYMIYHPIQNDISSLVIHQATKLGVYWFTLSVRPSVHPPSVSGWWLEFFSPDFNLIFNGLEYEHRTSMNMRLIAGYVCRVLLVLIICIFPDFFYAFLNEPGCSVMSAWCPDDNFNCFHWISIFWYMHYLGEDLGRDWIWASYFIKYAHNGWSCDLGTFVIPEVNFPAGAIKLDI